MASGIEQTIERAERWIDRFRPLAEGAPAVPRGIRASEALFVCAAVGDHRPPQVLESGRARGRSTDLLSRWFDRSRIISVESNPNHPDADRALENLRGRENVVCLFGDARRVLPAVAMPGDVAIIDGPKAFRALRLAMRLLATGRVHRVFIHDCPRGSPLRRHLQRHVPWAFFSDEPRFVALSAQLDEMSEQERAIWSDPKRQPADRSYGPTFACIPPKAGFPSAGDWLRLRLARIRDNARRSMRRRAGADEV